MTIDMLCRAFSKRMPMKVPTDLTHKVSPHFTFGELIKSQTATRHDIDNTPSKEAYASLHALCNDVLEPVRQIYAVPLIITSGYRCPELNARVGGRINPASQHTLGEAADFEPLGNVNLHDLWRSIVLSDIPFDQCILEFPPTGWIHVSHVKDAPQRGKITIARRVDNKTVYEHFSRGQIEDFEYDWE